MFTSDCFDKFAITSGRTGLELYTIIVLTKVERSLLGNATMIGVGTSIRILSRVGERCEGYVRSNILKISIYSVLSQTQNHENNLSEELCRNGEHSQIVTSKIVYNSYLEYASKRLSWKARKINEDKKRKNDLENINRPDIESNLPIALKFLTGKFDDSNGKRTTADDIQSSKEELINFPYSDALKAMGKLSLCNETCPSADNVVGAKEVVTLSEKLLVNPISSASKWMSDYECYDEGSETVDNWQLNYGTSDSRVPVSKTPCGGCGAILHCQDPSIPGYLPSELFVGQDESALRSIVCQRCHFMRNYNAALDVIVSPDDYPRLLAHLKKQRSLIILMIDLLDFPCSIWPGIMDIIGTKQPVVVVGNKVDLLPPDSRGYLAHVKNCLGSCIEESNIPSRNIKHIALISAKTGYGVEELITKIHNIWQYSGDVYLLGCTNVGKSTLFNALLQSDFCKVQAIDLVQRATTSPWPGTTLSLLKFPILRPEGWRLYERTRRIISERQASREEQKLRKIQMKENSDVRNPTLIGRIGLTFYKQKPVIERQDPFSLNASPHVEKPTIGLDPSDQVFKSSKWCYDTPGAVHPSQVIHLLTTEELMMTLPKKLLLPRTFRIKPYSSLFIGGLGRFDYIEGEGPVRMTVFASDQLPITVCRVEDADDLYSALLGTKLFGVPCGGPNRLAQWPSLEAHLEVIQLKGSGWRKSCADVLLSSAGWIAVTMKMNSDGKFQAWTPKAKGVYVRKPALLPYSVNLCGSKIRGSPIYRRGKAVFWSV